MSCPRSSASLSLSLSSGDQSRSLATPNSAALSCSPAHSPLAFPLLSSPPSDHASLSFEVQVLINTRVLTLNSLSAALSLRPSDLRHWLNDRLSLHRLAVIDDAIRDYVVNGELSRPIQLNQRKRSLDDELPDADNPPVTDSEEEFELERVLDRRESRAGVYYLIKWRGFDDKWNSWEPAKEVGKVELVKTFEKQWKIKQTNNKQQRENNEESETATGKRGHQAISMTQQPRDESKSESEHKKRRTRNEDQSNADTESISSDTSSIEECKSTLTSLIMGDESIALALALIAQHRYEMINSSGVVLLCPGAVERQFADHPNIAPLLSTSGLSIRWDVTPKALRSSFSPFSLDCILLAVENSHVEDMHFFRLISGFLRSVAELLKENAEFLMCCSRAVDEQECAAAGQPSGFHLIGQEKANLNPSSVISLHSNLNRFEDGVIYRFARDRPKQPASSQGQFN